MREEASGSGRKEEGLREGTNDEGMEVERWCKVLKYRLSTSNRPTKGILYINLA